MNFSRNGFIAGSFQNWTNGEFLKISRAFVKSGIVSSKIVSSGRIFSADGMGAALAEASKPQKKAEAKTQPKRRRIFFTISMKGSGFQKVAKFCRLIFHRRLLNPAWRFEIPIRVAGIVV